MFREGIDPNQRIASALQHEDLYHQLLGVVGILERHNNCGVTLFPRGEQNPSDGG